MMTAGKKTRDKEQINMLKGKPRDGPKDGSFNKIVARTFTFREMAAATKSMLLHYRHQNWTKMSLLDLMLVGPKGGRTCDTDAGDAAGDAGAHSPAT